MSNETSLSSVSTDVLIIGAGPVGLFAVFECGMLGLRAHVIDALPEIGGQCTALYPEKPIYDIPGFPSVDAGELIERLEAQAAPFSPVYHLNQRADHIADEADGFRITTSSGTEILARAVIIAAGGGAFGPNRPPLPDLAAYEGKSVFYACRSKAAFAGLSLAIAGGGDSAVDWAIALADVAREVTVIHRRPEFRAAPESVARLHALADAGKIRLAIPAQLKRLEGQNGVLERVIVSDDAGQETAIAADRMLAFFGLASSLGPVERWGLALDGKSVAVDPTCCATSRAGIYAIGDIASYPNKLKLILTGFAEAAQAAHAIYQRIHPDQALHFVHSTSKGVPGS